LKNQIRFKLIPIECWSEPVSVECTGVPIDKNIGVEYDHQKGYEIKNLGGSKIENAFAAAGIKLNFIEDEELEPDTILNDLNRISQYIMDHKNTGKEAYICSIFGLKDEDGNILTSKKGTSYPGWDSDSGSLICVGQKQGDSEYTIIHELGHHLGNMWVHCYSPYCCMQAGRYTSETSEVGADWGYEATIWTNWNPHFCESCINNLNTCKENFSE